MTRIFLLTVSNQYNAYNLILQLMASEISWHNRNNATQLILTDDKNIFTYCFQPMQRLQSNFKTDSIRNFMYNKHNGDNAKLRIFSFIPQRQRIQPNFMNHTYQATKQPNTTRTTKSLLPLTQSLCSYN